MSVIFSLTSAVIIAGATLSASGGLALISSLENADSQTETAAETMFVDSELLIKTLNGLGCDINVVSENEIKVNISCSEIEYFRANAGEPFKMRINGVDNPQLLCDELKKLENDYGRNVQAYTYSHIKQNLTSNMSLENEEFLEDDSVLLTISVE